MSQLTNMSTKPIYEDLKPKVERQETREAHILRVHIPPGFQRQHYGAKVEFDYSRVRVFGELPLEKNKMKRFNLAHQVPAACDINRITGKIVDGSIISITMPKKVPSDPVDEEIHQVEEELQPEPDESEKEEEPKTSTEAKPGELDSTEKATTDKEEPKTTATEVEPGEEEDDEPDGPPPPQQENVAPTEEEVEEESGVGKRGNSDHEEHQQPESSTEQNKIDDSAEATSPTGAKLEKEGKSTAPAGSGEEEKKRKEESEEDVKKPLEEEKATEEEGGSQEVSENERSQGKREYSSSMARSDYIDKKIETDGEKDERIAAALGRVKGTITAGFRKRFDEEDKRRVIYMGAAVVVVALGVYASYKFRSSLLRKY
ncbi:hypothetical protein PIB30_025168 [Stylosanthes scabra]|uniref:SHSP domain-containing protein n=1 Tax=Stylosanthes scabra TaxID=79078 RepID=A0ABU6Y8T1_9FABA|nr:hypothetical protein [Stylosanthes scabra]